MRKKLVLGIIVGSLVVSSAIGIIVATGTPGSEDDPVVTQSYVDSKIAELKNSITGSSTGTYEGGEVFIVIDVEAGKKVLGEEGSEMVLRSGQAVALDNGEHGVSDLTQGKDLMGGTSITPNHLLLVPRADGRGIQATTDIWMMVKGGYTIQ